MGARIGGVVEVVEGKVGARAEVGGLDAAEKVLEKGVDF